MGLAAVIRSAVKTADGLTKDLQVSVIHYMWKAQTDGGAGDITYTKVTRLALVDIKQKQVRTTSGELVVSSALVTFLSPVPITVKDKIELPDDTLSEILSVEGFIDPATGSGYLRDVWLG